MLIFELLGHNGRHLINFSREEEERSSTLWKRGKIEINKPNKGIRKVLE